MHAVFIIAAKDLRQRLRDRSAIVLGLIAPLAIATVMSFAFSGTESFHADVALVDLDGGEIASAYRQLLTQPDLSAVLTSKLFATEAEARKAVADGKVAAAWILPAGLTQAVTTNGTARITTITDVNSAIAGEVAASVANGFASQVDGQRLAIVATVALTGNHEEVAALRNALSSMPETERIITTAASAKKLRAINYYGPGMAIFFGFFAISFTARSWFADRKQGMIDRVSAAPIARFVLVVGKGLSAFVFSLLSLSVMGVVTTLGLHADWGPPAAAFAVCVGMALAITALAVLVITVARTERQSDGLASILVFGLSLLGGNFVFISVAPRLVRRLALLTPNGWALRAFMDLSTGAAVGSIIKPLLAMATFVAVVVAIAAALSTTRRAT
jgi:ABC-2 type transport system permease protein